MSKTPPSPAHPPAPGRRQLLGLTAGALALPALVIPGRAQAQRDAAWPNRPIRMVVPFATGGGTDVTMRLLAPKLGEILGQSVVIENRPGAGSTVGTDSVAKSAPDGYTFVLATLSSTGIAKGLYSNLPYDPVKDLTAVAPTVFIPISFAITQRGWNVKTYPELVETLLAKPNGYSYGSSGSGSTGHIASANFLRQVGAKAEHVPYRGAGQSFTALIAGETQFTHDIPSLLKPFHESGQARVLFVNGDKRSPLLPDVPAQTELGIPDYKSYSWYGIFGPANLPPEITAKMAAAIEATLADPAMEAKLNELGTPAMRGWSPARFAQYVKEEIDTWVPLVHASGASAG
ncbi:tripartite tricarboxylate transporter substrate binding protein [Roseomonas aerophila]|uniref:Tripartite tricarboxylate transporter substrate binding protein n=1 Tax=Teichococcus aerophilus TaxID=1224513 RepID=A0ABR7RKA3_9PROT|nr:tripartite tricarboxylate transporter substrate-binding protein [Pseudoroseomonas aerophila]MBC9206761.1 tripartite tricarboxylate transporter substrate binding protein [Pseudoroseomonas aerophila]